MAKTENLPSHETLRVALAERSYDIVIGRGLLAHAHAMIRPVCTKTSHAVVMFDEKIEAYSQSVTDGLQADGWRVSSLPIPSGESSKSVGQSETLWNAMLREHTDRGSIVVAIGGGVVGDLAGFMAATFARGIPLVQVPTTLLSQVDSSVGGKTGINLPGAKNIVGAFWQPSLVVVDTATLETLPEREFVSGLAEVAKYGVILLPELFEYLENNFEAVLSKDQNALTHIIRESCKAKAQVVQEDERETSGLRAILNYGHTFAHALESSTGYGTLLHGEAVSIGMHMAAHCAHQLGRIDGELVERQARLLKNLKLPVQYPEADPQKLWELMQHDKKVEHGKLRFILPSRLGHVELVEGVSRETACAAIESANASI